ncbi:conserved hypothetical protein [Anaeromyxobacter sp. K]|uniref:hypothetical protein n=1 Tax=Anaeromyxobacter sp. (strain K) TaxID=447217 RepID=UPI00017BE1B0|nr:hypothetical protein [Anaeromyxobacter sp. K]ACG71662.1 conserved hypothetical protein [Anaeromyxobacter sp. K]
MRNVVFAAAAAALVAGCAMPQTVVKTIESRPSLAVAGAPAGAVLVVDGQPVGDASAYDGNPTVLRVEPGTHQVEIRDPSGAAVYRQTVFVESELKTVRVH